MKETILNYLLWESGYEKDNPAYNLMRATFEVDVDRYLRDVERRNLIDK